MIKLREVLQGILAGVHPRVFFNRAPSGAQFEYLVYSLPSSYMLDEQEIWVLDVDIWDRDDANEDSAIIDSLTNEVAHRLHRLRHVGPDIAFVIYRENRFVLDDDDPRIRRRKVTFQLRVFDLIKRVGE